MFGFFYYIYVKFSLYMKTFVFSLLLVLTINVSFSQDSINQVDQSINGQFDKIYRTSTTYRPIETKKRYKVINIESYNSLKANVLDSINASKKGIIEKESLLKIEKEKSSKLTVELTKTKEELKNALEKENSISLFGLALTKTTYNVILWLIILVLSIGLGIFIFKFSRSNILTVKAKENLVDVEHEFEIHRKKSLEREQKLRRQLQDEINKQRNS